MGILRTETRVEALERKFREVYFEYYRHFHENPEPSYQEKETASYIHRKLKPLPFEEIKTGVGGCGVTALLRGEKPGPVIALRADMDALNVTEATGAPFASKNPGIMHACGHDAHMAMLLGAAHVLCEMKPELAGTVKFIFQPSEEMTPRGGAPGMIEEGVLENPRVDAILAMHVWPDYQTGEIGAQDGVVSAASDRLKIKITGKSAHASMPHQGIDAIVAAAGVISSLQSVISRSVDPREAAVVTIGLIRGGARYNVVAEEVLLDGTVRTFNPEVTKKMPGLIERTAAGAASAFGAAAAVKYESGYPSVLNAPQVSAICREAIIDVAGEKGLLPVQKVPAAGEDFSFFAREVPAAFAWLGCRPEGVAPEEMPPLHNDKFLPDPNALPLGVRYVTTAALALLAEFGK